MNIKVIHFLYCSVSCILLIIDYETVVLTEPLVPMRIIKISLLALFCA